MGWVHRRRVVDVDNEGGGVGGGCESLLMCLRGVWIVTDVSWVLTMRVG